jgi:hypothetical protein
LNTSRKTQKNPFPKRQISGCFSLKGVDFTHSAGQVRGDRAANSQNMWRKYTGSVQKRPGYKKAEYSLPRKMYAVHKYTDKEGENVIFHSGDCLYLNRQVIWDTMEQRPSFSVQIGEKMLIGDGKNLLLFDGENVKKLTEERYIPTLSVNRTPKGHGKKFQGVNILTPVCRDSFMADGSSEYRLSLRPIGEGAVTATVKTATGQKTFAENSGISVNRQLGTVTFSAPPRGIGIPGYDDVIITYAAPDTYQSSIEKVTRGTVLNSSDGESRAVLAQKDKLYISGENNPGYFSRDMCCTVGDLSGEIVDLSKDGARLLIHKKGGAGSVNLLVATVDTKGKRPIKVQKGLVCPDCLGRCINLNNDPLFLTDKGVWGTKQINLNGEYTAQNRSFYIDGLLAQRDKSRAKAVNYNDCYILAIDKEMFLLDSLQKTKEKDRPHCPYVYECYYWVLQDSADNIFTLGDKLYFSDRRGNVYVFGGDYCDGETPQTAVWESGSIAAPEGLRDIFALSIVCDGGENGGFDAYIQKGGEWIPAGGGHMIYGRFTWSKLNWRQFIWHTDTYNVKRSRVRVKSAGKTAVKLVSDKKDEDFAIGGISLEYSKQLMRKG